MVLCCEKGVSVLPMKKVNENCHAGDYGQSGYKDSDIFEFNNLYEAMERAGKTTGWKQSVQRFKMDWLANLAKMQDQDYELDGTYRFVLRERGKDRVIDGETFRDRVMKHSLCDNAVNPQVYRKLIYDNGATMPGKGISFTRSRIVKHLESYYRKHGNEGYVLIIDYSKYYDNIRHDKLMEQFAECIDNQQALDLLQKAVDRCQVDVSYMSDEEYAHAMDTMFNSLEYENIPKELLTKEKMLPKHISVGDQMAQTAGLIYPHRIDTYIKTVKGCKFYGRYMDDSYVFHPDKEFLESLLKDITAIADELGITLNKNKTAIKPLKKGFKFLQVKYTLTDTGKIARKSSPSKVTRMRRKMRKLKNILTKTEYENWFKSWYFAHRRYMTYKQKMGLRDLYNKVMEEYKDGTET